MESIERSGVHHGLTVGDEIIIDFDGKKNKLLTKSVHAAFFALPLLLFLTLIAYPATIIIYLVGVSLCAKYWKRQGQWGYGKHKRVIAEVFPDGMTIESIR